MALIKSKIGGKRMHESHLPLLPCVDMSEIIEATASDLDTANHSLPIIIRYLFKGSPKTIKLNNCIIYPMILSRFIIGTHGDFL